MKKDVFIFAYSWLRIVLTMDFLNNEIPIYLTQNYINNPLKLAL